MQKTKPQHLHRNPYQLLAMIVLYVEIMNSKYTN